MARGEGDITLRELHDRDREARRESAERGHDDEMASRIRRHDQRVVGVGEDTRRFGEGARIRAWRGRRNTPARLLIRELGRGIDPLGEHLARQGEVNRSRRLRGRDGERAIDHRFHLRPVAQLVIPFDELAQHARLVVHLLAPMDIGVARAGNALLVSGVRPAVTRIGTFSRTAFATPQIVFGAPIDMHHDGRDLSRHHRVTMRHRNCEISMHGEDRPRHLASVLCSAARATKRPDRC